MNIIDRLVQEKFSLSPLAGISDLAFRTICRKFGCQFAFTEMVDARALKGNYGRTKRMLQRDEGDTPLGVQLVGEDIEDFVESAIQCESLGFDVMNINAACPVPKIRKKGKGVAMMTEPQKLGQLIARLKKALSIPVVIKIRSGYDHNSYNYLEVGKIAEQEGVDAIFIHPRSAVSKYGGELCKHHIVELKEHLRVPIFASGSVLNVQAAMDMLNDTGCDAISVARGSLGQPWIFEQLNALFFEGKEIEAPSIEQRLPLIAEHFQMMCELYGFMGARPRMYKHLTWYFKRHKRLDETLRPYKDKVQKESDFMPFLREFL